MFRAAEPVRQPSFFNSFQGLPVSWREELQQSWATTFRAEVFDRIDETLFACLYSDDQASRPHSAVNVLVSLEILKSGLGWSDQELLAQVRYNLQIRHAVGLDELGQELFTSRTVYNFRRRVREHAVQTGENLLQKVFETVTAAQLAASSRTTPTRWTTSATASRPWSSAGRYEWMATNMADWISAASR